MLIWYLVELRKRHIERDAVLTYDRRKNYKLIKRIAIKYNICSNDQVQLWSLSEPMSFFFNLPPSHSPLPPRFDRWRLRYESYRMTNATWRIFWAYERNSKNWLKIQAKAAVSLSWLNWQVAFEIFTWLIVIFCNKTEKMKESNRKNQKKENKS